MAHDANVELTNRNGRRARFGASPRAIAGLAGLPALGVRRKTLASLIKLINGIRAGQIPRERVRLAQHMIFSDVLLALGRRHDPDLTVYFTNHVAAMMHRYWYAAFPDDWKRPLFDRDWISRYENEIDVAMVSLDAFVGRVMKWCEASDRVLVLASSMGQKANLEADAGTGTAVVLRRPTDLSAALGLPVDRVSGAMVPQVSWDMGTSSEAQLGRERIETFGNGSALEVDVAGPMLTVTYRLQPDSNLTVDGHQVSLSQAGFETESVDDVGTGVHDQEGILVSWNARHHDLPNPLPVADVAPYLLRLMGVSASGQLTAPASAGAQG